MVELDSGRVRGLWKSGDFYILFFFGHAGPGGATAPDRIGTGGRIWILHIDDCSAGLESIRFTLRFSVLQVQA